MKNLFKKEDLAETIERIQKLKPDTKGQWGKMTVAQMLAHVNVAYELAYENKHPRPNAFARFFIKLFVKDLVVGSKPYQKNMRTAPHFVIGEDKDFETEKKRLIDYLHKTQQLGEAHFEQKESHSLGKLSAKQWNVSFSKHLDHHLRQFGV